MKGKSHYVYVVKVMVDPGECDEFYIDSIYSTRKLAKARIEDLWKKYHFVVWVDKYEVVQEKNKWNMFGW